MSNMTYGEYLAPVYEVIDENFPEEAAVRTKDLKLIAHLTAATIFSIQATKADSLENNAEKGEE